MRRLALARGILLVALGIVVVLLAVLTIRARRPAEAPPKPTPPAAAPAGGEGVAETTRAEGFDFTRTRDGIPSYRIQASQLVGYEGGARALEDVTLTLYEEGTPVWTATGERARYHGAGARLEGNARLESHEGVRIESEALTYREKEGRIESDGPARFFRGSLEGRGDHGWHDLTAGRTGLEGGVVLDFRPGGTSDEGRLEASTLVHSESEGRVLAGGGVRARFGGSDLRGDTLELKLDPDGRPLSALSTGNARLTTRHSALRLRESGEGRGEFQAEARAGPERHLAGREIEFGFGPRSVLREVLAREGAVARYPDEAGRPGRVEGDLIRVSMDAEGKAERMEAFPVPGGTVRFVGASEKGEEVTATCRDLSVDLGSGEEVHTARFHHDVRLLRGEVEARGDQGVWSPGEAALELTGSPWVSSPQGRAFGERVVYREREGTVLVEGNVHSVQERPGGSGVPALFREKGVPVYVSAGRLSLDAATGDALYDGGRVHARQGDSSILSDSMTVSGESSRVEARGSVVSRIRVQSREPGELEEGRRPPLLDPTKLVHGDAEELLWDGAARTVTYRGAAVLSQEPVVLRGDQVDLHLTEEGGEVERAVAEGRAELEDAQRHAWGDRITYLSADETVLVEGGPARAEDSAEGAKARGSSLTLNLVDDTISVGSTPHGRTSSAFRVDETREGPGEGEGEAGGAD